MFPKLAFFYVAGEVTITRCQGEDLTLTCGDDTYVHVEDVFYGRSSNVTCARKNRNVTTSCDDVTAMTQVQMACEGQHNCEIEVGSFDDPCPDVYKYLRVTYDCLGKGISSLGNQRVAYHTLVAKVQMKHCSMVC